MAHARHLHWASASRDTSISRCDLNNGEFKSVVCTHRFSLGADIPTEAVLESCDVVEQGWDAGTLQLVWRPRDEPRQGRHAIQSVQGPRLRCSRAGGDYEGQKAGPAYPAEHCRASESLFPFTRHWPRRGHVATPLNVLFCLATHLAVIRYTDFFAGAGIWLKASTSVVAFHTHGQSQPRTRLPSISQTHCGHSSTTTGGVNMSSSCSALVTQSPAEE